MDKKICVYTCITGDYDNLSEIKNPEANIDYYCFTNNQELVSKTWKVIYITNDGLSDHQLSRYIKMLGHPALKKYDISVWMDASVRWDKKISDFVDAYLGKYSFAAFRHSVRDNVLDEARECIKLRKDEPEIIQKTIKYLNEKNFPDNVGLHEMTVFIKRNNDYSVQKAMEMWFRLNKELSRRDQLTIDYVFWETKLNINTIELDVWNNDYFHSVKHNQKFLLKYALLYREKYDIFSANKAIYTNKENSYSCKIPIKVDCNTVYISLYDIPFVLCKNLKIACESIEKIEYPQYITLGGGKSFVQSNSVFRLCGHFKNTDTISISFDAIELTREDLFNALNDATKLNMDYEEELKKVVNSKSWKFIRKIRGLFPPY